MKVKPAVVFLVALLASAFPARSEDAVTLEEQANSLFFQGKISQSIQAYKRALSTGQPNVSAYLNLSCAYRVLSEHEKSLEALKKALQILPADPDILSEAGWAARLAGLTYDADSYFKEALKTHPDHLDALLGQGMTELDTGRSPQATETLRHLCELRPNFGASALFLSKAYARNDQKKEARDQYIVALRKDWTLQEREPLTVEESTIPIKFPEISFTAVKPLEGIAGGPKLKIGIWANSQGRPPSLSRITLECGAPFKIVGVRSNAVLAAGDALEKWTVEYSKRGLSIFAPDGKEISGIANPVSFEADSFSTFLIQDARGASGGLAFSNAREFRGSVGVYPSPGRRSFYVVNEVALEEYLLGVLPSEMPASWPAESLKAQAVIARTYGLLKKQWMRTHKRRNFDICDSQHCQVYQGVRAEKEPTNAAARDTAGQVIFFNGRLAYSYYHSTCGGYLQASEELLGWGTIPYLKRKPDLEGLSLEPPRSPWELFIWLKNLPPSNCNDPNLIPNSEFRWLRVVTPERLEQKMRRFRLGKIKAIVPLKRSSSGHVQEVLIRGSRRSATIRKEHEIRFYLGAESLRSTLFMIETPKTASGWPEEFWIYGGGWGHGIGLCQSGAASLAKKFGRSYPEILGFYYPGTEIKQAASND